jgi:hypothetical protein
MNKKGIRTLMTTGFLLLLGAGAAYAQSDKKINVKIDFDFTVGDRALPAGEYAVKLLKIKSNRNAWLFQSSDGRSQAMAFLVPIDAGGKAQQPRLIFHRYMDRYFLAQVWLGADNNGFQLPRSRTERAVQSERRGYAMRSDNVAVYLPQ